MDRTPRHRLAPRAARTLLVATAVGATSCIALGGCGGGEQRVALAIEGAERTAAGTYRLEVECAANVQVDVRPDPAGSGLLQVTVWGDPQAGRCRPDAALDLTASAFAPAAGEPAPTKVVDGASSQVVELPTA